MLGSDVLQERDDKAQGSRGDLTAVQQSCQSTGKGGCSQCPHIKTYILVSHIGDWGGGRLLLRSYPRNSRDAG